jgi:hypothetical protein
LKIKVKNLGIPLRNPSLVLHGFTRLGWLSMPLQRLKEDQAVSNEGTLEKGMIVRYAIRSRETGVTERSMVSELIDPQAVEVSICVYSESYRVKEFRFPSSGMQMWLKRKWNSMAWTVNGWFTCEIERWGKKYTHRPTYIPSFTDSFTRLKWFVDGLRVPDSGRPGLDSACRLTERVCPSIACLAVCSRHL